MLQSPQDPTPSSQHRPQSIRSTQLRLGTQSLLESEETACRALQVTAQDAVIVTADGHRLPGVPLLGAQKPNKIRHRGGGQCNSSSTSVTSSSQTPPSPISPMDDEDGITGATFSSGRSHFLVSRGRDDDVAIGSDGSGGGGDEKDRGDGRTNIDMAPAFTDPMTPPLPLFEQGISLGKLQCVVFRAISGALSLCFLLVIVIGAITLSLRNAALTTLVRMLGKNLDASRPFYLIEEERRKQCEKDGREWEQQQHEQPGDTAEKGEIGRRHNTEDKGKDKLLCDIGYYARRIGLDVDTFLVETEDGFLLELHHVFDPQDLPYYPDPPADSSSKSESEITPEGRSRIPHSTLRRRNGRPGRRKCPVLLVHGLLQSAGAFCVNDEDSIAFFLVKSGYDVFLGNNRCGMNPRHTVLKCSDPKMWAWNIRQMGTLDLPAFINPILSLTSFSKVALVAHSQGTTQTFVALSKQQCPDIGKKISVFCALAPAVYAGGLIDKFCLKFMRIIPPSAFRIVFGIHSFIPFMMLMHRLVPAKLYGDLGYQVFWFLFGWSDTRWDRRLRPRFFRFAPVFVSAETMRWWLGRECFSKHRCILSAHSGLDLDPPPDPPKGNVHIKKAKEKRKVKGKVNASLEGKKKLNLDRKLDKSWYDERFPPLAMWVAGADDLVDGRRLIRRFDSGLEPHVKVVWKKVIDEYEHLDVIWAVDAVDQVFKDVRGVIWRCVDEKFRRELVEPIGVNSDGEEDGVGADKRETE